MKTDKILKKCDLIFNPFIFKICMLIITLLTAVPFIHMYIGKYVKIFLAYGVLSVIYLTFRKGIRTVFKDKLGVLLIAFSACYGVTILLNYSSNFVDNASALVYMVVFFFLFFIFTSKLDETDVYKEIEILSAVIMAVTFIFAVINFSMFALQTGGSYSANGQLMYYGMQDNRLWGLYNANTNSMLCDISIILSLGFILNKGYKKSVKALCIINSVFQYICLLLTGSRASLYGLYAIFAVISYLAVIKSDAKNNINKYIKGTAVAALSVLTLFVSAYAIKYVLSYVPSIVEDVRIVLYAGDNDPSSSASSEQASSDSVSSGETASSGSPNKNKFTLNQYDLNRLEEVENRPGGILTGRMDLWKAGIAAFKKAPLFGIGRENIYAYVKEELPGELWSESLNRGGLHNIYLTILVSSGIVGFLLMAVFAVASFLKTAKLIFINKKLSPWYIIIITMIILFYVTELVEARILYQVGIFYVIFWIYLGLIYALATSSKKQKEADK